MPPRRYPEVDAGESSPLAPSETALVAQTLALIVVSSWGYGGTASWAPPWILGIAGCTLPLLVLHLRGDTRRTLRALVPLAGWMGYLAGGLANPSHAPAANGGWVPRAEWIRWLPTTTDAGHTLAEAPVWLAVLLQGAALHCLLRRERAVRLLWAGIAINGFALAAIGGFYHLGGINKLPGMEDAPAYSFATFYYKNHWAAYGALAAIAGIGLALRALPRALAGDPPARGAVLLFGAAALLTLITLPLPGSRSGVLLGTAILTGGSLVVLRRMFQTKTPRRRSLGWIGATAAAALGLIAFGVDAYAPRAVEDLARTREQLERGAPTDTRIAVSRDTWKMAQQRPWFGWGPGCFEVVFPAFQGNYLRDQNGRPFARFEYAHNDWLQLLAESGIVGGLWWLLPVTLVMLSAWRGGGAVARWGLYGCGLIAAYAWLDFPFHNPAVLMLWTVILTTMGRWRAPTPSHRLDPARA